MRKYVRRRYKRNPLKAKALNNRLEDLDALGLPPDIRSALQTDLSEENVTPDNAIYVLDWWRARLSLMRFLDLPDERDAAQAKVHDQLLGILQSYANKYKLTGFEMALDGELQIDYWEELRHFIQMSGINPYFRKPWPFLHTVVADLPTGWYEEAPVDRVTWLGVLAKENINSTVNRPKFRASDGYPAIKLLRAPYWGDPAGHARDTELPKAAIVVMEGTHKPSSVLAFLKEAEASIKVAEYFIPRVHKPFLTFTDKKCWVVVDVADRENERQSLGDCATGEYTDTAMVIISLREPVMAGPSGTYYRTLLRAELVFPQEIQRDPSYEQFKDSAGVINQLRATANSKPKPKYHQYIVPLLAQPWASQLVRPNHRPDDIFWLSDLSPTDRAYLQSVNPKLFDAKAFYAELENLSYPKRLEDKIIEGIEFPTSYVIEVLSNIAPKEFDYHSGSARSGIVTRALRRRLQDQQPDPELQELLAATEAAITRMGTADVAQKFESVGFVLSTAKIEEVLQVEGHPLGKLAAQSLAKKIADKVPGIEHAEKLAHQALLTQPKRDTWPQNDSLQKYLIDAGIYLTTEEVVLLLGGIGVKDLPLPETIYSRRRGRRVSSRVEFHHKYSWNLALHSIKKLDEAKIPLGDIPALLEEICLDPETPYIRVGETLDLGVVELSEKQIQEILSAPRLLPGQTLTALDSLETKTRGNALKHPKKTLDIARKAMLRIKERDIVKKTLPWIDLPTNSLIEVLNMPRVNRVIRDTAIDAIELKINNKEHNIRSRVFVAVRDLLLRTREKSLIKSLLHLYKGHQDQYRLFYTMVTANIQWLAEPGNRTFFLGLISENLPGSKSGHSYSNEIPRPIFRLIHKLVSDDLVEDNCTFVLKLLFRTNFNDASIKMVQQLLDIVLDKILEKPDRLTSDMCRWFRESPAGWGTTEHLSFRNKVKLTPKLLRQFQALFKLSIASEIHYRSRECYLDLAVTIAEAMRPEDKKKIHRLAVPLVKYISETGHSSYTEYLTRILGKRRLRRRF